MAMAAYCDGLALGHSVCQPFDFGTLKSCICMPRPQVLGGGVFCDHIVSAESQGFGRHSSKYIEI